METQFALPKAHAEELSRRLPIYHPYGSLGPLPWENAGPSVEYGKLTTDALLSAAGNLRTFTEQVHDDSELEAMYAALSDAEQIVFLGFSYLPQNMELLRRGAKGTARHRCGLVGP